MTENTQTVLRLLIFLATVAAAMICLAPTLPGGVTGFLDGMLLGIGAAWSGLAVGQALIPVD